MVPPSHTGHMPPPVLAQARASTSTSGVAWPDSVFGSFSVVRRRRGIAHDNQVGRAPSRGLTPAPNGACHTLVVAAVLLQSHSARMCSHFRAGVKPHKGKSGSSKKGGDNHPCSVCHETRGAKLECQDAECGVRFHPTCGACRLVSLKVELVS